MSCRCWDCGISSAANCICMPEAVAQADYKAMLREEREGDDHARRVSIQHAIAQAIDALTSGPYTSATYVLHLTETLGDIATDVRQNVGVNLDALLVQLAAAAQLWLETRAREHAHQ